MKDKVIKCQNCQQEFAFTTDEQDYYARQGWPEPKRCPICRAAFQQAKEDKFRGELKIKDS